MKPIWIVAGLVMGFAIGNVVSSFVERESKGRTLDGSGIYHHPEHKLIGGMSESYYLRPSSSPVISTRTITLAEIVRLEERELKVEWRTLWHRMDHSLIFSTNTILDGTAILYLGLREDGNVIWKEVEK